MAVAWGGVFKFFKKVWFVWDVGHRRVHDPGAGLLSPMCTGRNTRKPTERPPADGSGIFLLKLSWTPWWWHKSWKPQLQPAINTKHQKWWIHHCSLTTNQSVPERLLSELPSSSRLCNILKFTWPPVVAAIIPSLHPGPPSTQPPDQPPRRETLACGDVRTGMIHSPSPCNCSWFPLCVSRLSPHSYQNARMKRSFPLSLTAQLSWVINKLRIFFALICLEAFFFFFFGLSRNMFGSDSTSAPAFNWIRGKSG